MFWRCTVLSPNHKQIAEILEDYAALLRRAGRIDEVEKLEARAKGGTMLLNIGPEPNGEIPNEQERILRELDAWMFINSEAIYAVRPWKTIREGNIWFTKKKDENTVYAFITQENWEWGTKKKFVLKSVQATAQTEVSVLGQNDIILEYQHGVSPKTVWIQKDDGLYITATRAQRIYNDRTWPNPVVLKITHAMTPES